MGRKSTGRTTKLIRIPVRFENQVKKLIEYLKIQEKKEINRKQTKKSDQQTQDISLRECKPVNLT